MKISVIIPVYNEEEKIKRAIRSVPARKDIEILVIDDGSTDNTFEVVNRLMIEENENISVARFSDNQGVATARNYGFDMAQGEYIMMLDADDYIIPEAFDKILTFLDGTDLVYYNLELNSGGTLVLNPRTKDKWVGTTKLIRREFMGDIRQPVEMRRGEDWFFYQNLKAKHPYEVFSGVTLVHYDKEGW